MKTNTLIHTFPESRLDSSTQVNELAGTYGGHVLRCALRIVGQLHLAEEIQQDVFVKLLIDLPADVDSWPALLATMTTRTAIDHLRKSRRLHRLSLGFWQTGEKPSSTTPEETLAQTQQAQQLRDGLARLRKRDAQAFCLHYFNGLTGAQIGKALGVSESNANVIVHRARHRLTAILSQAAQENSND